MKTPKTAVVSCPVVLFSKKYNKKIYIDVDASGWYPGLIIAIDIRRFPANLGINL